MIKNIFENLKKRFAKEPTITAAQGQFLDRVVYWLLAAVILLFPLAFVPALANWFDLPKQVLLIVGSMLAASLWLLHQATTKKLNLVRSPFDLPLVLFLIVSLISVFLTINRTMNFYGDVLVLLGAATLFFLITQTVLTQKSFEFFVRLFLLSALALSFWTALQVGASLLAPILKNPLLNEPILSLNFSPVGSSLAAMIFLVSSLSLALGAFLNEKKGVNSIFLVGILLGVVLTGFVLYKNPPVLLSVEAGWKISTGTMGKSIPSALFGIGPANFVDAYTQYRPADLNATKFWNLRFTTGANYYFYLISTVGIAGLATFIWLIVRFLQMARKRLETPASNSLEKGIIGSLMIVLLSLALLPGNSVVLVVFFVCLGLFVAKGTLLENSNLARRQTINLPANPWADFVPGLVVLIITGFLGVNLGKFALGDYYFAQSLKAAAQNQGTQTYNLQIKALSLAPDNTNYHVSYSQTNLALADSLAGQQGLSDQQKQTVVQLVQQSIREGRTAVALNPNRAALYENLSMIYRSLINFAQGADQWSVAALQQAIALDPANPSLRLDLGGLYFAGKDYLSAAQIFNQAVTLKSDLPNAHYNLAQAFKNLNMKDQAIKELQLTSSLICLGDKTTDCDQVNAEIATLNAPAPAPQVAAAATTSAQPNLPKAAPKPAPKIGTQSGEITP
jgi:hypothetical protein